MRALLIVLTLFATTTSATADARTDEICRLFTDITSDAFTYQNDITAALGRITQETITLRGKPDINASAMAPLITELQKTGEIVDRYFANDAKTKRKLSRAAALCDG